MSLSVYLFNYLFIDLFIGAAITGRNFRQVGVQIQARIKYSQNKSRKQRTQMITEPTKRISNTEIFNDGSAHRSRRSSALRFMANFN